MFIKHENQQIRRGAVLIVAGFVAMALVASMRAAGVFCIGAAVYTAVPIVLIRLANMDYAIRVAKLYNLLIALLVVFMTIVWGIATHSGIGGWIIYGLAYAGYMYGGLTLGFGLHRHFEGLRHRP